MGLVIFVFFVCVGSRFAMMQRATKSELRTVFGRVISQGLEEFLQRLIELASDTSPVIQLLMTLDVLLSCRLKSELAVRYSLTIYAYAYYLALAESRSRTIFCTQRTIWLELNGNFHPSDCFHDPIMAVTRLVVSTSDHMVLGPCLVPRIKHWFINDNIHLSTWGAKCKTWALLKVVKMCRESCDGMPANVERGLELASESIQLEVNKTVSRLGKAMSNRYGAKQGRIDYQFEENHYKLGKSQKRMAVWLSQNNLDGHGKLPCTKTKMYVFHGTSMHRDLISPKRFCRKGRYIGALHKCSPAIVTVSPGATGYHLAMDLLNASREHTANTAHWSIMYLGTNEKLGLYDLVLGFLCDEKLISKKECSICERNRRRGRNRGQARKHGLDKVLSSFRSLLRRLN